jgi:hypothetical protein
MIPGSCGTGRISAVRGPGQSEIMTETKVHHITTGDSGYVTMDTTYFPIVKCWWAGVLSPESVDKFWVLRDEILANRVPLVVLIHHIDDSKPVEATSRKYLAEKAKADPRIQKGEFISVMVVMSAILRGVMTAVTWMAGDEFPMEFVSNMEQGFKVARKLLEKRDYLDIPTIDANAFTVSKNPDAKL